MLLQHQHVIPDHIVDQDVGDPPDGRGSHQAHLWVRVPAGGQQPRVLAIQGLFPPVLPPIPPMVQSWPPASCSSLDLPGAWGPLGGPKIALQGGGWHGRPAKEGGGGSEWASVPGPLFCVRTDVATKGAGTQILARKIFFHEQIFPHICVVKMISTTWGSF